MRRFFLIVGVVAVLVGAMSASWAAPGGVVVSPGFEYVPGDNDFAGTGALPPAILARGGELVYVNADVLPHSVTSTGCRSTTDAEPCRFDSGLIDGGEAKVIAATASLRAGSYGFYCKIHPFMQGTLQVVG